jgi:hypothetical protein
MNLAAYNISYSQITRLLKEMSLFKSKGLKIINNEGVSDEFRRASLIEPYSRTFQIALKNFDYDFLLIDDSFFQFQFQEVSGQLPKIRFAYFQSPQKYISFDDFSEQIKAQNDYSADELADIEDLISDEYEQFLLEQGLNESSTPIRYDVDQENYFPLMHAASHIHIGKGDNVRIPIDKVLTPFQFALFTVKHTYYNQWSLKIKSQNKYLLSAISNSKATCVSLPPCWEPEEKGELYFT